MVAKVLAGLCILALIIPGCSPGDNTIPISPEEAAKVSTAPTASATAKGKSAVNPRASVE